MSFSSWPPGLLLLAHTTPKLSFPPLFVFVVHQYGSYKLPNYIWAIVYLLATPSTYIVYGILQHFREENEIKRLGARRVPQVPAYWPGGLDLVWATVKSFDHGYPGDAWGDWIRTHGPIINIRVFWTDLIITTEPDHIKAILATNFDNFEKGETFRWYVQSVLGTGVFNSDGDMWKFHRAMTRPFFARDRVTDFDLFDRHAEVVITKLKERFAQGEAIDFQDIMSRFGSYIKRLRSLTFTTRFTLDSATEFLFGSSVHTLVAPLPYAHNSPLRETLTDPHFNDKFAKAFTQAQYQIALRYRLTTLWPLLEFWKDKTTDAMKVIYSFIDPILEDVLAKKAMGEKKRPIHEDDTHSETLLDHLVEQTTDPVILRDETFNILIAGRDTTMATLTFIVYCLSQHPDVLLHLREEILTKVGPTRKPTFDDVKDCRYLRAVINETLRLYPVVPFNTRHSKRSSTWPASDGGKPYYIPAGIEIPFSVWLMQRRTDLWGPDASEFDPSRFLDDRLHEYLIRNPFIYLPFNAGPRICLGQQFAYNETSFMLIRLLQAFDTITFMPEAQPPESRPPASWKQASGAQATDKLWPKSHLTLYSHMGLWLTMGEAQYTDTV